MRKIPGREHYGDLVLRRGAIGSLDLYNWWDDVRNGNTEAFRTATVQLQNEDHTAMVLKWRSLRTWPERFKFSALDGKGGQPLLEVLELAFERLEME